MVARLEICPLTSCLVSNINETAGFINKCWGHLLEWDGRGILHPHQLREYANALSRFGVPSSSIIGFIDCTIRPTCCPGIHQELVYTGYKKCHGMKYQAVVTPNGLIAHLSGPYRAPQNDCGVLKESSLLEYLEKHAIQPGSMPMDLPSQQFFQVYGDSAYGVSEVMIGPYVTSSCTAHLRTLIRFPRTYLIGPYLQPVSTSETLPVFPICMTLPYYVSDSRIQPYPPLCPPFCISFTSIASHYLTCHFLSPLSDARLFPSYSYPLFPDSCPILPDFPYTSTIPSGLG